MSDTTEPSEILKVHNREVWGRMAPSYASTFETLTGEAVPALLDGAGVGRGTALLDVGTGPGTLIGPALGRGATVRAVDLAEEMVASARLRHPEVDVRAGDAHALPFDDSSFDAVTFGFCLHHIPHPERALAEARRVLRSGGRVAFSVWAAGPRLELFGIVFDVMRAHADLSDAPALQAPAIGEQAADYEALLERAGFVHPTARVLEIGWELSDGGDVFEAFDAYFDLGGQQPQARAAIREALDNAVQARVSVLGRACLPNPAVVASARVA